MSHTAKSFNTLISYNTYPVQFLHEDKLIIFSRLFCLWNRELRTRIDFVELTCIETPYGLNFIEQDKATSFEIYHN